MSTVTPWINSDSRESQKFRKRRVETAEQPD
jgi:hypothetical protein